MPMTSSARVPESIGRAMAVAKRSWRSTLLYKYCVSHMAWSRARVLPPPDVPLTPRHHARLTELADPHAFVPSRFSDGPP